MPELARKAIESTVAKPLKMSLEDAALGIHRVINAHMAEGIRLVTIRQGHDPRKFALLPLGGAGPLHACPLAEDLGITRIVVPPHPGVLSAAGLLGSLIEHEASAAFTQPVLSVDIGRMREVLAALDAQCGALMREEKVSDGKLSVRHVADVCYIGQAYSLEVEIDAGKRGALENLTEAFYVAHDRIYGYAPRVPIKIVNVRSVHSVEGLSSLADAPWQPSKDPVVKRKTRILVASGHAMTATVYDRAAMAAGFEFAGPAIVEQTDTTTLVTLGWKGVVDADGTLTLEQ
jgi:N-methylhydantoinase A